MYVTALPDLEIPDNESAWQDHALCAQVDPELFFPEQGGSTREAKMTCAVCEVRPECLQYALAHDERFGIWGGMSERERRRLKHGEAVTVAHIRDLTAQPVTWTADDDADEIALDVA